MLKKKIKWEPMKKVRESAYIRAKRRQVVKLKYYRRKASKLKQFKLKDRHNQSPKYRAKKELSTRIKKRNDFKKKYYRKRKFDLKPVQIDLPENFGIEEDSAVKKYFEISQRFVDTKSSKITFNMKEAKRIWPSAITLLCSMAQWVDLVSSKPKHVPMIYSVMPDEADVSSYLKHCGFDKYVNIVPRECQVCHDPLTTVQIMRETDNSNAEKREDQITELLKRYTNFSSEDLEWIDSAILEIFLNVTEHGKQQSHDTGWWVLCQYHDRHKLVSICIADNGIGIRHSLMTGPQAHEVSRKIVNKPEYEGEFIKLAVTENVSGAVNASLKKSKFMLQGYASGSRRGNGLKRIINVCRRIGITLTILSNSGYCKIPGNGDPIVSEGFKHRVFAGTMYHLSINTERVYENN